MRRLVIVTLIFSAIAAAIGFYCGRCSGATFPSPVFPTRSMPRPVWTSDTVTELRLAAPIQVVEPEFEHTAKPTVKPVVLNHNYRTTSHQRWCMMCLGQHLRNMHGEKYNNLDKVGYRNWVKYHEQLHDRGTVTASRKSTPVTSPVYCVPQQTKQRRGLICRLRGG